ncbi:transposase [Nonomuraea sp. LPB2021202275-12-8]|uniref:transposase n=1 Tax=Nonomuraea sp. LPB2021202275-12-8 TaxID=3120159 RepID=UPI003FA59716
MLAFIHTGITNAGSEGTNRVIKTVARDAYGFHNPELQRLRTRCATTRRDRGQLNPA